MIKIKPRNEQRKQRHQRVRVKLNGTAERPRLNVFRSNKHIYAQIIDDQSGRTLVAASSLDSELQEGLPGAVMLPRRGRWGLCWPGVL